MQFTVDGSVLPIDDVTISGNTDVGSLLTVEAPNWNVPGVATTYQWQRNGANISGQTGTSYTLVQADVGKTVTVKATGTKAGYATGTSISNGIGGTEGPAPVPSQDPSINGTPRYGQTLTADPGVWPGPATYKYQWLRRGTAISGATGKTYHVQGADGGQHLSVRVTATITGFAPGVATSPEVTVAKLTSTTTATLLGKTIRKGAHGKVSVSVTGSGVSHATGALKVKQGKKVLTTVNLKSSNNGRRTITLPKLGKGKHRLKIVYGGSSTVRGSTSKTVTLKVTS
jgi:hypothetical protein